jgi:hypothetical protein
MESEPCLQTRVRDQGCAKELALFLPSQGYVFHHEASMRASEQKDIPEQTEKER